MKYHDQLKHPLWQKKRLEVLELHNFICENCGDSEEQLHVHHKYYKRGAMIWEYDKYDLSCLCGKCHISVHAIDEQISRVIHFSERTKEEILGFISAPNHEASTHEEVCEILLALGIPATRKISDHFAKNGTSQISIGAEIGYEKIERINKIIGRIAEEIIFGEGANSEH